MRPLFIENEGIPIDFGLYASHRPDKTGLQAVGANFLPDTLLSAYSHGLFPWFIQDGFPFWYNPDPRMVLIPSQVRVSDSMRKILKRSTFQFSCDRDFNSVIRHCSQAERQQKETWIDDHFITAYGQLHALGIAHSFEVWQSGHLVGGLYGLALGRVFFGESMFSDVSNSSKAAFIQLARFLAAMDFVMIDCQVPSDHLSSLGARPLSRSKFLQQLKKSVILPGLAIGSWTERFDAYLRT
jgi:leucyl/phenylalanyl-tRNA---protein transferase